MDAWVQIAIGVAVTTAGTALIAVATAVIKWVFAARSTQKFMCEMTESLRETTERLTRSLRVMIDTQRTLIEAQRTTFDVLTKKRVNGTIGRARDELCRAEQVLDGYLADEALGERR